MSLKNQLKKFTTLGAFTLAGITSAFDGNATNTELTAPPSMHQTVKTPSQKNAPVTQNSNEVCIFTLNGTKYLVPNEGDTLQSYRERLKTKALTLDKQEQEWQKKNNRFVNTTPVQSVIDLCKNNLDNYLYLAYRQIAFSQKCSEDKAIEKLADPNNPWKTLGHLALKERNERSVVQGKFGHSR